jgi:CheY-like chemotaxis protein
MTECRHAVLIVDDDHDVREALREVLQDHGYDVLEAGNGHDALALLRDGTLAPCLILLDIMMPVMDGWQFRAAQRNDPALAGIPVVVLSAHGHVQRASEGMDATAFLRKPVQLPPLLATVARYCPPP